MAVAVALHVVRTTCSIAVPVEKCGTTCSTARNTTKREGCSSSCSTTGNTTKREGPVVLHVVLHVVLQGTL